MKLFSFVTNQIKGTLGQWFVSCRFVARSRAIHSLHTSAPWGRHSTEILSKHAIAGVNRLAESIGLVTEPIPYEQIVASCFQVLRRF
jgi:hypothetical protein